VKKVTILIRDTVLQTFQAVLSRRITTAQPLVALISNVGTILKIVSSLGVDIPPASAPALPVDAITDESVSLRGTIQHSERYEMSPLRSKRMFLTPPLYYVNGLPHLGHVFTTTLVEAQAKWHILRHIPLFSSSDTDEHGLKVQTNGVT
jgi:methionyl-tRNA synthetase